MQPVDDDDADTPAPTPAPSSPVLPADPFPALLSDDEIENRLKPATDAAPLRRYQPITVIREQYPHVAERLALFWGQPEFDTIVESLVVDPSGRRAGFPPPVLEAILALARVHRAGAEAAIRGIDVWVTESTRRGLR